MFFKLKSGINRMLRLILVCSLVVLPFTCGFAQYRNSVQNYQPSWAVQLVKQPKHNFGVVARGSDHAHEFEFVNTLTSDIVLSSVRASCGCASPSIVTSVVKPGQTGKIRVKFNTMSFLGDRHARITATISSPQYTELYLDISGHVRRDIVVTPGQIDFGLVSIGTSADKSVDIRYAGMGNWQVTKVESANPNLELSLEETKREGQRIDYRLHVKVNSAQPAGMFHDQIILHTNDAVQKQFPITATGSVKAVVETQSVVDVGELEQGKSTTHRVVLKSDNEFVVTKAETASPHLKIKTSEEKKRLHILEIEVSPDVEGKLSDQIVITTDAQTTPTVIQITGKVLPAIQTDNGQK
jgi:hypothetical protein